MVYYRIYLYKQQYNLYYSTQTRRTYTKHLSKYLHIYIFAIQKILNGKYFTIHWTNRTNAFMLLFFKYIACLMEFLLMFCYFKFYLTKFDIRNSNFPQQFLLNCDALRRELRQSQQCRRFSRRPSDPVILHRRTARLGRWMHVLELHSAGTISFETLSLSLSLDIAERTHTSSRTSIRDHRRRAA